MSTFHVGDEVKVIVSGDAYTGRTGTVIYVSTFGDAWDVRFEDGSTRPFIDGELEGPHSPSVAFDGDDVLVDGVRYVKAPFKPSDVKPGAVFDSDNYAGTFLVRLYDGWVISYNKSTHVFWTNEIIDNSEFKGVWTERKFA